MNNININFNLNSKTNNLVKGFKNFFKINPHKHWAFLLRVFFVLTTILILFSLYLLYQIKNDQIFQVKEDQTEKKNLINDALLKKNMSTYDQKMDKIKNIELNPNPYQDPSI